MTGVMQEAIVGGLVADGAVDHAVPAALCNVELLAPWVTTNEVSAGWIPESLTELNQPYEWKINRVQSE